MLKVHDGLDHYNVATDLQARSGFLSYTLGGSTTLTGWVTGVFGEGRAAQFSTAINTTIMDLTFQDDAAIAYLGLRFMMGSECGVRLFFQDSSDASTKLTVYFNPRNRSVEIWYGDSTSGGIELFKTENTQWSPLVWNFVEVKPRISLTEGEVVVLLNGAVLVNLSGVNTHNGTNAWFDRLRLQGASAAGGAVTSFLDDVYYSDPATGGIDNFVISGRTATLFAAADDAVTWMPLSGTNFEMIDEVSMDSDTSYNSSSTLNNADTFTFGALPAVIYDIVGVQATAAVRKDDAGARSILLNAEADEFAAYALTTSYTYTTALWESNPTTGYGWSPAEVDAIVVGYKVAV